MGSRPEARWARFAGALTILAVVAVGSAGPAGAHAASPPQAISSQVAPSPHEPGPSALDDPGAPDLPRPLVNPNDLISGGPPPDGIPALDHSRFEPARRVAWLQDREPVLALDLGGESRAYPVQVLIWHEIVNDTVGGIPVAITYCPLCNSAIAFDRRLGNRVLDFGTSGRLYHSDLVMYDRQTDSLWEQFQGLAVAGRLTGTQLSADPISTISWGTWRVAHPDGFVLSRNTGYDRPYGQNPYNAYDDPHTQPFLLDRPADPRMAAKTRVLGIDRAGAATAITFARLRHDNVEELDVDGPVVVWFARGTSSALNTDTVARGRDVGATGAFDPQLAGQHLHFIARRGDGFQDRETVSTWNLLGHAVAGPLTGQQLTPVTHLDTFWFAWSIFKPDTTLLR
jgi:hypothetical protein